MVNLIDSLDETTHHQPNYHYSMAFGLAKSAAVNIKILCVLISALNTMSYSELQVSIILTILTLAVESSPSLKASIV